MKELIFEFVNQYAVWGILIITFMTVLILWRMHRQVKRLNRNLAVITGNVQEYFKVIMEEEPKEEERPVPERESRREDWVVTREEREALLSGRHQQSPEDEAVFNAVLQEYFP